MNENTAERYGVGVYIARDMGSYKFTQKDLAVTEKILTNLETALSLVGSSFMKKIDAVFAEQRKGTGFGNHDMNNKEIKGFAIIIMGYDGRPFGYDEHQSKPQSD